MITITPAQLNPIVGALDDNRRMIIDAWAAQTGDLVVFSELVICGYPPEDLVLKPAFMDEVKKTVAQICKESAAFKAGALIGCPWVVDGHTYNAALLIEKGEITATILKHHLPDYGVFDESRVFARGPLPCAIAFRGTKLGIMICEDMWYGDVAGKLKGEGAEMLIVLNASPYDCDKDDVRLRHAKARVAETGLPLIYVNQVGGQDELVFDGGSFVMDAGGEIASQLKSFEEEVSSIDDRLEMIDDGEKQSPSSIIHHPSSLESIYRALTLGLRDYVRKNNFPGVLIGLSGGIDSALATVIAVDALGADKVRCVMMPSQYTSQESLEDAEALAKNLGVRLDTIPIETPVNAFTAALAPHLGDNPPGTTFENIQPRTRGIILMALSNATGHMVLSTGNKSELATGYATLYGDMCGGFNPLKDVYKTQVYALSNWRNAQGVVIPERIITKAPTAELKENQTDQDTLPPYDVLDAILECLIERDMSADEAVKLGYDRKTVMRVWNMLDRAEYKRRQSPPGTKITARAFGRDRRYPMTNHFVNVVGKKD